MTPLPVLDCSGCGLCCLHQAGLPITWYGCLDPEGLARLPAALRLQILYLSRDWRERGSYPADNDPCVWYDQSSRRCKHYEYRPEVCRAFEMGGADCLAYRREGGLS